MDNHTSSRKHRTRSFSSSSLLFRQEKSTLSFLASRFLLDHRRRPKCARTKPVLLLLLLFPSPPRCSSPRPPFSHSPRASDVYSFVSSSSFFFLILRARSKNRARERRREKKKEHTSFFFFFLNRSVFLFLVNPNLLFLASHLYTCVAFCVSFPRRIY